MCVCINAKTTRFYLRRLVAFSSPRGTGTNATLFVRYVGLHKFTTTYINKTAHTYIQTLRTHMLKLLTLRPQLLQPLLLQHVSKLVTIPQKHMRKNNSRLEAKIAQSKSEKRNGTRWKSRLLQSSKRGAADCSMFAHIYTCMLYAYS